MRYLIDTNSVIYLFTGKYPLLTARLSDQPAGDIGISTIVFAELIQGSTHGKPPLLPALEAVIAQMPLMPFDEPAARSYARLPFRRGRYDRLLAAHALSLGATVITANLADFADVPGLQVEDWSR